MTYDDLLNEFQLMKILNKYDRFGNINIIINDKELIEQLVSEEKIHRGGYLSKEENLHFHIIDYEGMWYFLGEDPTLYILLPFIE